MTAAADEVVIWQAEGVVMQQQGCSAGETRVRLQALARSVEVSLAILCLAVVRDLGHGRWDRLAGAPAPSRSSEVY